MRLQFKVGDKIVDFGQVYRIFKIKKQKNTKGKEEKIIFFKPCFKTRQNRTLVCSIPVNNIGKTQIRRPISKKQLGQLFKRLSKNPGEKTPINVSRAREILNLNNPYETAWILKSLWIEKNDKPLTKTREEVFRLSIKRLVEEVAFVNGVSLAKAGKQIEAALERGVKNEESKKT